jgi:hypothetical protein
LSSFLVFVVEDLPRTSHEIDIPPLPFIPFIRET